MRVLYAIQGTGNGHLARATEIVPLLKKKCQLDILLTGYHSELRPPFELTYKMKGLGFMFGKKGGIDFIKTFSHVDGFRLRREVRELPVEKYDLIINDFEPVSAWAGYYKNVPVISLSHQCALLSPNVPQPEKISRFNKLILRNYAPAPLRFGFHFENYDDWIFTPVIRGAVRSIKPKNKGHITVYLPSYGEEILIRIFNQLPAWKFHVFNKHSPDYFSANNVEVFPVSDAEFLESFTSSSGVICGAGFETPAEALFLGKKLLVIPMKNQFEQHFNAAALNHLGVPVLLKFNQESVAIIREWLEDTNELNIAYPDHTSEIIDKVLAKSLALNSVKFDDIP